MKDSPDKLRQLGPLIKKGEMEELRKRMIEIWPPNSYWDEEDIKYITLLLLGVHNLYGGKGQKVYEAYSKKLKSPGELEWLSTLDSRVSIVRAYEGFEETLKWLNYLKNQIIPPNDGVVSLEIGNLYFSIGDYPTSRNHYREAVDRSLQGIAWYRIAALNAMTSCLIKLGESRLAFEYARTVCMEGYKLRQYQYLGGSKTGEKELYQSIYGLALLFGQIDYAIDIRKNLADHYRKQSQYSFSSLFLSDAAFQLAELGLKKDAAILFKQAANEAIMGSLPGDPAFAAALELLAIYSENDSTKLNINDILNLTLQFAFPPMEDAIRKTQAFVMDPTHSPKNIGELWQNVVKAYDSVSSSSIMDDRYRKLLVGVHAAALVSRFLNEKGHNKVGVLILETIAKCKSNVSIVEFAREQYIETLINDNLFEEALDLCEETLLQNQHPLGRFTIRNLASRSHLGLGNKQKAYSLAKMALSDWHRILEGLYVKERKLSWLNRGVACISCVLASMREPQLWISEKDRKKALFDAIELQKARLATDMMTHNGHIPGSYELSKIISSGGLTDEFWFRSISQYPDWMTICMLQMTSLFCDAMFLSEHNEDLGDIKTYNINLEPLKSMLQMPIDPEKQLLATASSLSYEGYDEIYREELWHDLVGVLGNGSQ